jgi:hypothetical protein
VTGVKVDREAEKKGVFFFPSSFLQARWRETTLAGDAIEMCVRAWFASQDRRGKGTGAYWTTSSFAPLGRTAFLRGVMRPLGEISRAVHAYACSCLRLGLDQGNTLRREKHIDGV